MGSFIESVTELSCHFTYTLKIATLWRFNCSTKRCEKNFLYNNFLLYSDRLYEDMSAYLFPVSMQCSKAS